MKHSGIVLGVILSMVAAHALGIEKPRPAVKPRLSVSANLNPQSLSPKTKPSEAAANPETPSVLEAGSRVVASNTPDEDFVILGSLEPTLPEPKHIETDAEKATVANEVAANALGDIHPMTSVPTPPAMLKAPVEVKAGIQAKVPHTAVMVAGPNIGATPAVKPAKMKPITSKVAPVSRLAEASALAPPPQVDTFLERPDKKNQQPAPVLNKPVKLAVATPVKPVVKAVVKIAKQTPMKTPVKIATKAHAVTPVKVLAQSRTQKTSKLAIKAPAKPIATSKLTHLMAKAAAPCVKPVHVKSTMKALASHVNTLPAKTKLVFASYHPPKHGKPIIHQVVAAKPAKPSFKPVIKSFKPTNLHVERKSHFHPVIKPYIAS